jgi:hypothetical protein
VQLPEIEYCIMIKGSVHQEHRIILNVMQLTIDLKTHEAQLNRTERRNRQIYNYPGEFTTPLEVTDMSRWKISKDTEDPNDTRNQCDLMLGKHPTQ